MHQLPGDLLRLRPSARGGENTQGGKKPTGVFYMLYADLYTKPFGMHACTRCQRPTGSALQKAERRTAAEGVQAL